MSLSAEKGAPAERCDASTRDAVHAIMMRVQAQIAEVTARMVERYREEIPDYRLTTDDELLRNVYEVSLGALEVTVANVAAGLRPTAEELEVTRAGAARRVHQHVSLESFLHALRVWGRTLWETVIECVDQDVVAEREAALTIAGALLEHIDLQSSAATQGYMNELQSVWSDREVLNRDLLDGLLAGDGDSDAVKRLARSLRVPLAANYFVVIVRGGGRAVAEPEALERSRGPLRKVMEATRSELRSSCSCGVPLIGMRQGEVVALYPFQEADEGHALRDACTRLVDALAKSATIASAGLSGANPGLSTLSVSYSEARDAIALAGEDDERGHVVAFEDVLIDSVLSGTRHAERIISASVGRLLEYDRARQSELVPTLRAYVASGFNLAKSAEALSIHPNTVVYRLGRIRDLSGRDPHDPDDLLLLQLGLKLIELRPPE